MDLLLIAAMVVAMVLFVFLPQRRRMKAHEQLVAQLKPGVRVMLASGLFGTITSIDDDRVRLEIAPGVEVEALRRAVAEVDPAPGAAMAEEGGADRDAPADAASDVDRPRAVTTAGSDSDARDSATSQTTTDRDVSGVDPAAHSTSTSPNETDPNGSRQA